MRRSANTLSAVARPAFRHSLARGAFTRLALAGALALPMFAANATLGSDAASVEGDRAHLQASVQRTDKPAYAVHLLTLPSGTLVREYVAPGGSVFGVTWNGPSIPDLKALLGEHFTTFTTSPNRQKGGRGHLVVTDGALVVESNGRMRSFHGRAFLTNAIPAGVSANEIE